MKLHDASDTTALVSEEAGSVLSSWSAGNRTDKKFFLNVESVLSSS